MNNQTSRRIWLTDEQRTEAIERFKKGESPVDIAKSFDVCANNIRNALRKAGLQMRSKSEALRRHTLNEQAFDVVTPEAAYWLGFLFADGSLYLREYTKASPVLTVGLAERDRGHLVKLKKFLGSSHTITESLSTVRGKSHGQVRLTVGSVTLSKQLAYHGMRLKSLERTAPPWLVGSRDFWRGLVDGDGFITVDEKKPRIGVCGGPILMDQFLDYFRRAGIAKKTEVHEQISPNLGQLDPKPIYRVTFVCGVAVKAIEHLYTDTCVSLDRKQLRAEEVLTAARCRQLDLDPV